MHREIDKDVRPDYPVSWQAVAMISLMRSTMRPISSIFLRHPAALTMACRAVELTRRLPSRLPEHVRIAEERFGACGGEWVRAGEDLDEGKVLLYFHGGGYFFCSPATHRPITWRLSAVSRRPVLALDYRQGPVYSLAESLTDAVAAYECLLGRGYSGSDIILSGDSAGGHLTLATLLALRDSRMPLPAAAICLSPWTDLTDAPRQTNRWLDPMLPAGRVEWLARRWTDGLDPKDPLVSPAYGDYTGLPPLMIVTGSTEVLRDEARRVAQQARRAGVPVRYEEWRRMPHVFAILADVMPEARLLFRHISRFLAAAQAIPEPVCTSPDGPGAGTAAA
ncbi:acetyl esterase/lipase [Thermocatellispora tengchongensis]|uniref:Acetyl esterase/lipase n=1 Tax=Thermocatellispora tengchongensis TaxID=1073253 RepID=A0A840P0V3_9ACTN|nr:alpha/beta hydrolase [Thermocatellispora tengchongensis]MBB5132096.1 acetyl esterase/lipase [Thermocatellispora tengchongensis]